MTSRPIVKVTRRFEASPEREFVRDGRACDLSLTDEIDPKWPEYAERTRAGWTTMLTALKRLFEEQVHE